MTGATLAGGERGPLFASLEVIDDEPPQDAALNMATDEALLAHLRENTLLRIYRWRSPAVSCGYFDKIAAVGRAYPDREIVRRWTGGGVVEHGRDFTYSLIVPRIQTLTGLRADESYRLIHEVLANALAAAGLVLPGIEKSIPGKDAGGESCACFVNAVRHDLLLNGHKIAGAAQRRTRHGWLHQGSVLLPGETADLYGELGQTLPAALAPVVQRRKIRPAEKAAAEHLARTKYGTDAWLHRY